MERDFLIIFRPLALFLKVCSISDFSFPSLFFFAHFKSITYVNMLDIIVELLVEAAKPFARHAGVNALRRLSAYKASRSAVGRSDHWQTRRIKPTGMTTYSSFDIPPISRRCKLDANFRAQQHELQRQYFSGTSDW